MELDKSFRIGLVGTGYIANIHAEVLKNIEGVNLVGCCDISLNRAQAFSKKWGILKTYNSILRFLEENRLDVVHVLVPPPFHHEVAKTALQAGVSVFIEKPMCLSKEECNYLVQLATKRKLKIGVNHNAIFHPLFLRLKRDILSNGIGKIHQIIINQTGPLGQLSAGKFSHWMFQSPENIIFEQAPHPISQIRALLGELVDIKASAYGKKELTPGQFFYDRWQAIMECKRGVGFIHLSFGDNYYLQNWIHVTGQDGAIYVDLYKNLYLIQEKSIFPDYLDPTANAFKYTPCILQGVKNFVDYALSKVKLRPRSDVFFIGMKNSIEAFYKALRNQRPLPVSGEDGSKIVEFCEKWIEVAGPDKNPKRSSFSVPKPKSKAEILVTGANGFIGSHLVKELIAKKKYVKAFVRSHSGLKPVLHSPLVELFTGDIINPEDVRKAIKGVKYVYHLAHGGGETWEDFYKNNVLATKFVGEACLKNQVKYLVFTSTIAIYSYIDFKKGDWITEKDHIDSRPQQRNFYARSKFWQNNYS